MSNKSYSDGWDAGFAAARGSAIENKLLVELAALKSRLAEVEKEHANDLEDLETVARHCSLAYEYMSGGKISKPLTLPEVAITLSTVRENDNVKEAVAESEQTITHLIATRDKVVAERDAALAENVKLREAIKSLQDYADGKAFMAMRGSDSEHAYIDVIKRCGAALAAQSPADAGKEIELMRAVCEADDAVTRLAGSECGFAAAKAKSEAIAALRAHREKSTSPLECEHANEVPSACPCDAGCYCKTHTCKEKSNG